VPAPPRDTALVFDLENLVGGYGQDEYGQRLGARLENISVPDVVERITEFGRGRGLITEYAVKRAYADWSKGPLAVLRKVLVDEGIEPRQIFAFASGGGGKSNAADVELVIDVLDLAYTRPEITTFVVVSGDGGFGTLIRRLHEFGKSVIVAAYLKKAHRGLRAVADEFIELDLPPAAAASDEAVKERRAEEAISEEAPPTTRRGAAAGERPPTLTKETLREALRNAYPVPVERVDALPAAALALMERLASSRDVGPAIDDTGLPMGTGVSALQYHLDRSAVEAGFGNFTRLLRVALAGSAWCVANDPAVAGDVRLAARKSLPENLEPLDDLPLPGPIELLRQQLKQNRLVVPEEAADLWAVAEAIVESPIAEEEDGETLMERLVQREALGDIDVTTLRQSLVLLSKSGALTSTGTGSVAERRYRQPHADLSAVTRRVRELIKANADGPDEALVDEILRLR